MAELRSPLGTALWFRAKASVRGRHEHALVF